MSELANKIKALRGKTKGEDAGQLAGISRESIYRIERGGDVKLSTLRQIAKGWDLSDQQWLDLLVAWLKQEAGDDANLIFIEPKEGTSELHDAQENQVSRAMMLYTQLNPADRDEISKAMQRPEVRACLPAINRVWEKFNSPQTPRAVVDAEVERIESRTRSRHAKDTRGA